MNAIGYMRLSSKDQSKSLEYQESTIREYCRRNELELLGLYKDNGESSYTFDRPDYRELENFLKSFSGNCDFLVVLDHDRFSRNLPEALMKISELEKKYGVKVLSTSERVDLDTSDPDVFMKRAFDYMIANRELFSIRNRCKQGIRNARENGRYLGKPPIGYKHVPDKNKKNLIAIDRSKSAIIERVFSEYLLGVAPYIILKNIKQMGFRYTNHNAVFDILKNPLYAGLIRVPAFKELPEKFVKGIHEPIISETDYWMAQRMLSNKRPMKVRADDEFPLRGILKCWCGQSMTAGWTKGKCQYYLYYRCIEHTNINIPGQRLHDQWDSIIKGLHFSSNQLEVIKLGTAAMLAQPRSQRKERITAKMNELAGVGRKIRNLEEKFINNEIESSTYKTWYKSLQEEKAMIELALKPNKPQVEGETSTMEKVLPELKNLFGIYEKCNVYQKHAIIRAVFKGELSYLNGEFRTPSIDPTFEINHLIIKEKGLILNDQACKISDKTSLSTLEGIRTPDPRFRKPLLYPTELPRLFFKEMQI